MKKFLLFIAAALFAGSMMAQVTITPANFTPVENSDYSTIVEGVTVAVTKGTVTADQLRIFKYQSITISAEANIIGIEFTCTANGTAKYGPGCFAAQEGYTFEAEGKTGTWEGSATSVSFTAESNQVRVTQIVVTLEGGEPVVVDTYTVAGAPETLFGSYWNPTDANNDMVKDGDIYKWEKKAELAVGTIEFQVFKNHDWSDVKNVYPAQTYEVSIAKAGEYALTITFNPATEEITFDAEMIEALADPTNCAEAAAAALSVSANDELYNNGAVYTIEGFVTSIQTAYSEQYHNITFWMADEKEGGNVLEAFRAACAAEADAPAVGDKVAVTGSLTKYNSTPEFAAGCTFTIIERAQQDTTPAEEPADVVFVMEDFAGQGTSSGGGEVIATKDGVTFWCDKAFGDGQYGVRCYKNSVVTISSDDQQIGKIVFEFAIVSGEKKNGGLDDEIVVNGMEWIATLDQAQARMNKISIYFGEYERPQVDTITATQALEIAQGLEVGTTQKAVVMAYVAKVETYDEHYGQYGNISVYLTDDATATYGDLYVYRAKCSAEDGAVLAEHSLVLVEGNLTHTQNVEGDKDYYEFAQGARLKLLKKLPKYKIGDLYYNLNRANKTAEVTYFVHEEGTYGANQGWDISEANIPSTVTYNGVTYDVTSIGEWAFACTNISFAIIPASIQSIGAYAFYASNLESMTFLGACPTIDGAFGWTYNFKYVYIPCEQERSSFNSIYSNSSVYGTPLQVMYTPSPYIITAEESENGEVYIPNYSICDDTISVYAYSYEHYHFVKWEDGTTDNPRTIYLTQDMTIKALFSHNPVITYAYNSDLGSVRGDTITRTGVAVSEISFEAIPRKGCYFVRWADGNTENPRTIELSQDTTMEAIFDYIEEGKCGKDNVLTWTFDKSTMALSITGRGALSENYTYGTFMESLTIGDEVTAVGQSAFYDCNNLKNVILGSSVKVLEEGAFYGCPAIETITCYSQRPPTVNNYALYSLDYSTIVYVPAEYLETYKMHDAWGLYDVRPIGELVDTQYTIYYLDKEASVISNEFITLHFPQAPEIEGFTFIGWQPVAGIIEGNAIEIEAVYEANEPSSTPAEVSIPDNKAQKLIRNGNVYILRGEKTYTIQGQEVK